MAIPRLLNPLPFLAANAATRATRRHALGSHRAGAGRARARLQISRRARTTDVAAAEPDPREHQHPTHHRSHHISRFHRGACLGPQPGSTNQTAPTLPSVRVGRPVPQSDRKNLMTTPGGSTSRTSQFGTPAGISEPSGATRAKEAIDQTSRPGSPSRSAAATATNSHFGHVPENTGGPRQPLPRSLAQGHANGRSDVWLLLVLAMSCR